MVARTETHLDYSDFEFKQLADSQVLAFDLSLSWQRIHEPFRDVDSHRATEIKKQRFFTDALTFAKESNGVAHSSFPPYIIDRSIDGSVTLSVNGYGAIREVYNPHNPAMPWPEYRLTGINYERALCEYDTFKQFEASIDLQTAKEGDMFVWDSMPPTEILEADIDLNEKEQQLKELGYGFHTNLFVFTLEGGNLKGEVLSNYLNAKGQRELLKQITGKDLFAADPTDMDLLSTISKVQNDAIISGLDIKTLIESLAENPAFKVVVPEKNTTEDNLTEVHIETAFRKVRPLLEETFYLLHHSDRDDLQIEDIRSLIQNRFNGWQSAIKLLLQGEILDTSALDSLAQKELEQLALAELTELKRRQHYASQHAGIDGVIFEEQPKYANLSLMLDGYVNDSLVDTATNCGVGSGFSGYQGNSYGGYSDSLSGVSTATADFMPLTTSGTNPLEFAYTYHSAETKYLECTCPFCDKKITAEIKNGKIHCTNKDCQKSAPYKC